MRGARQVGKSSAVRHLGKSFEYYLEVNFERDVNIAEIFGVSLNPKEICAKLSAIYGVPVISGKTLLFFDEIQSCLPAIASLRFFYEEFQELHINAWQLLAAHSSGFKAPFTLAEGLHRTLHYEFIDMENDENGSKILLTYTIYLMNILITAIHSFIGGNIVAALKVQHTIYGLDIVSSQKDGVLKTFGWNE